MRPAAGLCKSALEPTARCAPFSTIISTDLRRHQAQHQPSRSTTPTSAVPATTTEEKFYACASNT